MKGSKALKAMTMKNSLGVFFDSSNKIDEEENQVDKAIPIQYKDEVERKLEEIHSQIEMIGLVCDRRMALSYDEYQNSIKSNKAQLWEDLSKLNFKLIEFKKQNTKEDFVQKLKADLKNISQQVHLKDKELDSNTKIYDKLSKKVKELKEEKDFLTQEIKNSRYYNQYLLSKLKELEEADPQIIYNEWLEHNKPILEKKVVEKDNNSDNENYENQLNMSEITNMLDEEGNPTEKSKKLEYYIDKNLDIMENKMSEIQTKLNTKYYRLSLLEKFNNPILQTLNEKTKEQFDKLQKKKISKLTSQEIFFKEAKFETQRSMSFGTNYSKPTHFMKNFLKKNKNLFENTQSIPHNNQMNQIDISKGMLHKRDRREIIKEFLDNLDIKKYVYDLLYKVNSN